MLTVFDNGKLVNIKRVGEKTLEKYVLDSIKNNYTNKKDITNHYFKRFKMKPHKKLNDEMSFIECALKYDNQMLFEYVQNLNINAPGYNVINVCIEHNKIDLFKKYIKEKVNIEQSINGFTPLTLAIKKRNKEVLEELTKKKVYIATIGEDMLTPLSFMLSMIKEDVKMENTKNYEFYDYAFNVLLPKSCLHDELCDHDNKEFMVESEELDIIRELSENFADDHTEKVELTKIKFFSDNTLLLSSTFNELTGLMHLGNVKYVMKFFEKRPYAMFMKYNDEMYMNYICKYASDELLKAITDKYHYEISHEKSGNMHVIAHRGKFQIVKNILEKNIDTINSLCDNKRILLQSALLSTNATDAEKIDMYEFLIKNGININIRSVYSTSAFDVAIQYCSPDVVNHMAKHTEWNFDVLNPLETACQFEKLDTLKILINNDIPVTYFTVNKIQIPKIVKQLIIMNNTKILKYVITEPKLEITQEMLEVCVLFAQTVKAPKSIVKLLKNPTCDNNEDMSNDEILRLNGMFYTYCDDYNHGSEGCDDAIRFVKFIILCLLKFVEYDKKKIIKGNAFDKEVTYAKNNGLYKYNEEYKQKCYVLIVNFLSLNTIVGSDIDHTIVKIITDTFYSVEIEELQKRYVVHKEKLEYMNTKLDELMDYIVEQIENDYNSDDICDNDSEDEEFEYEDNENEIIYCTCCKRVVNPDKKNAMNEITIKKKNQYKCIIDKENNEFVINEDIFDNYSDGSNDDVVLDDVEDTENTNNNGTNNNDSTDVSHVQYAQQCAIQKAQHQTVAGQMNILSLDIDKIRCLLSRVTFPFKLGNYNVLHKNLTTVTHYVEHITSYKIYENNEHIATIFKGNKHVVPKWIEWYGYNIGVKNKLDENHMFSFGIDILLHNLIEKEKCDITCTYGIGDTSTAIYFLGSVLQSTGWKNGHFQYYLNDKNILFHRLFKQTRKYYDEYH
jgi:ankyrin repeat protein